MSIASTIYFHLVLGIDREFLRGYFFKGHFKANFGEHVLKVIYFEVVKIAAGGPLNYHSSNDGLKFDLMLTKINSVSA